MSSKISPKDLSIGEPVCLEADRQFRTDLEQSLANLTQARLMEAEEQAVALLENAATQAQQVVAKAHADAKALLAETQANVDTIRETAQEEGFKRGYQEGYETAMAQAEEEATSLLDGAHRLAEGAYLAEKQILNGFEQTALNIVKQVTTRILADALKDSPEAILGMIERAVEDLYLTGKVKVVVSAQTVQDIRSFSATMDSVLTRMNRFEWTVDPLLDTNQIYVIGQSGSFDISPNTQAHRLLAPLADQLDLDPDPPSQNNPLTPGGGARLGWEGSSDEDTDA